MQHPEHVFRSRLHDLSARGQSVWIDYLSRDLLETGELPRLIDEDAVVGVTSNPSIFQKAISGGSAYDSQLRETRVQQSNPKEIFYQLAARDIAAACDLLRTVWNATSGLDGYVSWEIDPNLAGDREKSIEEAHRLHAWIDRPNLYVKIPATTAGVGAIEDMIAVGKNINVTLIFSLRRYREVVEAYIGGLERLVESGGNPAEVHAVASFFVSRVDTEADRRLDLIGGHDELRGKLGIANAKLAYQHYLDAFSGPRWEALAAAGATKQRCLWASTSTKNPSYPDVMYVEGLIGPETVNTMPEETIRGFQDHGRVAETLTQGVDEAKRLLEELQRAGVDYDDVVLTLEHEGVEKFVDAFTELLHDVQEKRELLVPAGGGTP
jgi:transaldolase